MATIKKINVNGVEHDIAAHTAEYAYKDARGRRFEETYTTKEEIINADYVTLETLNDWADNINEQIPYGDKKYYYSINLTVANTVRELVEELKTREKFDENNEGKFYIKLSDDTILEDIHIKWTYSDKTHFTIYYITSIIRESNSIKIYADSINMTQEPLTITDFITQHKPVASTDYVDNAVANAGGGASGKEVITADNDFYNSILDQNQTTQGELFINFSYVDFNNKYVYLDLANYMQNWDDAQDIYCEFMYGTIKNATILIKSPFTGNSNAIKYTYFNFKDGGMLFLDHITEQSKGAHFDINGYSNLGYEGNESLLKNDFGFSFSGYNDYFVKIEFDEIGFAKCFVNVLTEI